MFQKALLKITRMRKFRSGMIALCVIGATVLATAGPLPLLANPGTVTVRVDPATRAAPVNGVFTVNIVAGVGTEMNPNGLGAYEFDLVYDPNYLEVVSVSDAGDLGKYGRPVPPAWVTDCDSVQRQLLELRDTSTAGKVAFGGYSVESSVCGGNPMPGPTGTAKLATVTLRAKQAGMTTLSLENVLLTDTRANVWPDAGAGRTLNVEDGTVIISVLADFDGDWKRDLAIYHSTTGRWYVLTSGSGYTNYLAYGWGGSGFTPLCGDFDGDGKADFTIYHSTTGKWYVLTSSSGYTNYLAYGWGGSGFTPVPEDYDGDGKSDFAIYHSTTGYWYVLTSSSGYTNYLAYGWGGSGFTPVPHY